MSYLDGPVARPELDLLAIHRGSIVAAAGCGKTQLIADTLAVHPRGRPVLILTHTNAGRSALEARLHRAGVPRDAYRVRTLDGWAIRLIGSFPRRSGHDLRILELARPRDDYPAIREAAAALLRSENISDALRATYARVFVDEYQDCSVTQHQMVVAASEVLPTCVLGDPLQAIFDFGRDRLVAWDDDVLGHFPPIGELQTPWRWINAGTEGLGSWLLCVRSSLISGRPVNLQGAPPEVRWIRIEEETAERQRNAAAQARAPDGGTVLVIAESANPHGQRGIASRTPGAHAVEAVELSDLTGFGRSFNPEAADALKHLIRFAGGLMTKVHGAELLRRVETLSRGAAHNPPTPAEAAALAFKRAPSFAGAAATLGAIARQPDVRVYRPVVLKSCHNALQAAAEGIALSDATIKERERYRHSGRPLARLSVGSTLLLKGLEADAAVVLYPQGMNAQHLYVALTRAVSRLVICSEVPLLRVAQP